MTRMSPHWGITVLILVGVVRISAVSIPPKIIEQSDIDIFFKDGESVKILCKASGEPTPKYSWKRADEDFQPEGNEDRVVQMRDEGTIIINRPEDKDEGFYQCFATNDFGVAASNKFNLRQARLSEFQLTDTETVYPVLGAHEVLGCSSPDSVPDAEIYWETDDDVVFLDARVTQDYDDSLHFTYIDEPDNQCFHCTAYNAEMRKNVRGPKHCIETTGKSLSMGGLALAWPKDQSNEFGLVGDSLKLKCIYAGYPIPTIRWSRQSGEAFDSRVELGRSFGQEILINDLRFEDAGTYTCQASLNSEREELFFNVKIESRPTWVIKPEDVTVGEGAAATFQCEGDGEPKVKINWFINGVSLEDALKNDQRLDKDHFRSVDNRLEFMNLRTSDSLVVQCNVTNSNGFVYGEAFLNVLAERPSILEEPENTKVAEGTDFQLTCSITGMPDPIITWYKDDYQVTGGRYAILESGSLAVSMAVLSDAGTYVCHAQNIYGEVQAQALVIVRRKTVIEMAPMDLEVKTGTNAKFTCSGTTDPQEVASLTTTWHKDGKPVELGTRMFVNYQDSSLTISGTEQRDTGTYECVVSNGLDNDTKSAVLVVTDLPFQTTGVDVLNSCAADKEVELEWMPGAFNNAPIQYFIVEYQTATYPNHWIYAAQVNYTKVKAYIPLASGQDYSFRVTSYNKIGPSPPSSPSTTECWTKSAPPSQNPKNVRTIGDMPGELHIEWTPVPPEHQGGEGFIYLLSVLREGDPESSEVTFNIPDWRTQNYTMPSDGGIYTPYRIEIRSTNNDGDATESPEAIIGHSNEGMPLESVKPSNLIVVDNSEPEYVTLQWNFDRGEIGKIDSAIQGEFRGFKVQVWEENRRSESIVDIDLPPESLDLTARSTDNVFVARVRHLLPNMVLEARVSVMNNFYVSAPSEETRFTSPPGLPGPVSYLEDINIGDTHIYLEWRPPLDNRGDLLGFDIGYQEVNKGLELGQLQDRIPQVDDPYATNIVLGGLKPETKYRIFVWARTAAGRGQEYFIERRTIQPGLPEVPRFTIAHVGHDSINVTWWSDGFQESGSVIYVEYKKKDGQEWISTSPESSLTWTTLYFLEPGLTYNIRIVVTNGVDINRMSETEYVTTDGVAKAYDLDQNLAWFLGLILAILLQLALLVLLFYCYTRGSRFTPMKAMVYESRGYVYPSAGQYKSPYPPEYQEPNGYSNDYYGDDDPNAYEDQMDGYSDFEDRYNEESVDRPPRWEEVNDEDIPRWDHSDEDKPGFITENSREGGNSENDQDTDFKKGGRPYKNRRYDSDVNGKKDPESEKKGSSKEDVYEEYDMDSGRRYPADPAPHDSDFTGTQPRDALDGRADREPGLRTPGYRTENPRDVRRDAEAPGSSFNGLDPEPGLRTEGYRQESPRESRRRDDRDLFDGRTGTNPSDSRNPQGESRYPTNDSRYPTNDSRYPQGDSRYPQNDRSNDFGTMI